VNSANEYAAYYLEQLRQGHAEDAFFGLIEGPPDVVPALIDAFAKEENRGVRADIVRCIWQHRRPEAIGFLAEVLHDPEPAVWQEALDGLVALGGSKGIQALQAARSRVAPGRPGHAITAEWLDEALEQLRGRATE
jgi:hypothetical protein